MKINEKDLINRYKAYIKSKSPHSRKKCPSREDLAKAFDAKASEKQKTKIINHISECHDCAEEFGILRQIFKTSREMEKEMGKHLSTEEQIQAAINKANLTLSKTKTPQQSFQIPFRKPLPKYLSWAAALVVLLVGTILIVKWPGFLSEKHEQRGAEKTGIFLIQPKAEKSIVKPLKGEIREPLIFKWEKYPETEYYILKLYNEALIPLYESEKIVDNKLKFPSEVLEELPVNKTYFWMVTAFAGPEKKAESDLQNFQLKNH